MLAHSPCQFPLKVSFSSSPLSELKTFGQAPLIDSCLQLEEAFKDIRVLPSQLPNHSAWAIHRDSVPECLTYLHLSRFLYLPYFLQSSHTLSDSSSSSCKSGEDREWISWNQGEPLCAKMENSTTQSNIGGQNTLDVSQREEKRCFFFLLFFLFCFCLLFFNKWETSPLFFSFRMMRQSKSYWTFVNYFQFL